MFARLLSVVLLGLRCVAAVDSLVDVNYTRYQGTPLQNGVTQWLGMRYAAPPLDDLRFAAPQDPLQDDTTQVANKHGLICIATGANATDTTTSEDCLFLDVYAPTNASNLPVFFFIQGGGFNVNSNSNYNGSQLIEASGFNIVVVNFNYRVGPYGFLAGEEVLAGGSLNNGLKDQRKALEWVQRYISRFGGNPNHVTLGGDSAGGQSVTLHLTAYGGRDDGLFHATAAESQSFSALRNVSESQFAYNALVIRTGCASENDTLACLRSLNSTFLQQQNFNTPFPGAQNPPLYMYGPTLDYDLITDYTYRAYTEGKFIRVPAIYGDDTNEGTVFAPKNTSTIGQSNTFLQNQFPALTLAQLGTINSLYPATEQFNNSGAYWRQVSNAYGEMRYICPGIYISDIYQQYNVSGNWNYRWNVIDPVTFAAGYGVTHTVEVAAIWGMESVNGGGPASYNTTNSGIVPVVQGYWTSFVRSFDPNMYRLNRTPIWHDWGCGNGYQRLMFQTNETRMETVPEDQKARCAYLNSIGVDLKQ